MRQAVLKLTMDYKMAKHMLNNSTLNESRTWLLVRTWHCYFISFNNEHPVSANEHKTGQSRQKFCRTPYFEVPHIPAVANNLFHTVLLTKARNKSHI